VLVVRSVDLHCRMSLFKEFLELVHFALEQLSLLVFIELKFSCFDKNSDPGWSGTVVSIVSCQCTLCCLETSSRKIARYYL